MKLHIVMFSWTILVGGIYLILMNLGLEFSWLNPVQFYNPENPIGGSIWPPPISYPFIFIWCYGAYLIMNSKLAD